jgi:hypothetical protein
MSWLGRCLAANPAVRAFIAREAVQVTRRRREAVATLAAAGLERAPGGGLRWSAEIERAVARFFAREGGMEPGRRLDVTPVSRGALQWMRRTPAVPSPELAAAIERAAERRRTS